MFFINGDVSLEYKEAKEQQRIEPFISGKSLNLSQGVPGYCTF